MNTKTIACNLKNHKKFKFSWLLLTSLGFLVMGMDTASAQIAVQGFCWFINNFKLIVAAVAVIAIMVWGIMYMMKKRKFPMWRFIS